MPTIAPRFQIYRLPLFSIIFFAMLMMLSEGCGRKPKAQPEGLQLADQVIQKNGISLYPNAELIDQSLKTNRIPIPAKDNRSLSYYETMTASVWLVTEATVETVRDYYRDTVPHLVSEQTEDGGTTFLQLASVPDLDRAVAEKESPVVLINIRKKKLTPDERQAYSRELTQLKELGKRSDLLQKRRMHEIERLLAEKTFLQINIRSVK